MCQERFDCIAPLLAMQPYITSVEHIDDATGITHDLFHFRMTYPRTSPPAACKVENMQWHNLVNWQQDALGITEEIDISPWLTVPFSDPMNVADESKGKAVFARSLRYHNTNFKWTDIVAQYPQAIFVGIEEEVQEFWKACGTQVPWRPTSNLLEVAQLIKGSTIFVSNQSVGTWIAIGLGHPFIQEVSNWNADSIIPRENGDYRRCL